MSVLAQQTTSSEEVNSNRQNLKKLSPIHIEIVKAHLDGVSGVDIGAIFSMTSRAVSRILNDPLVLEIKDQWMRDKDAEFDALYDKAIAAVRSGLEETATKETRLKAAKMVFENAPSLSDNNGGGETAEDVIERILQLQVNVQVNNNQETVNE